MLSTLAFCIVNKEIKLSDRSWRLSFNQLMEVTHRSHETSENKKQLQGKWSSKKGKLPISAETRMNTVKLKFKAYVHLIFIQLFKSNAAIPHLSR